MRIDALQVTDGPQDLYSLSFRNTLEALLPTYRTASDTVAQAVQPNAGVKWRSDLYGYLNSLKIRPCYHWFIMRLNNFFSPFEFDETVTSLLIPNTDKLTSAAITWKATQVIAT